MTQNYLSRRKFLEGSLASWSAVALPGCSGSDSAPADGERQDTGTGTPTPTPTPTPSGTPSSTPTPSTPPPAPGAVLTRIKITSTIAGTLPYSATVCPLRGAVPTGYELESPDDGSLRCSVLSRHDDGSVALAVVAGRATVAAAGVQTVRLQAGVVTSTPAFTVDAISLHLRSVSVSFGSTFGTASLTSFSTPERIWWANGSTICARYRCAPSNPGDTSLEAVIDVQAWTDRVLVEVVIENSKMSSARPAKPTAAAYPEATVTVNDRNVATGKSTAVASEPGHSAFRAWYCRAWVGAGDPRLVAHQEVSDLQEHPLLWRMDQKCGVDLAGYANDSYVQWGFGRKPDAYMGGVGDVAAIGPLTQWDARWLQSGDPRAANAVDVQALMTLHWNINHREVSTGRVPTHAEVDLKSINGNRTWPLQSNADNALEWELMHHPAVGLAAFLARPSPIFMELAQKIAIWNAMWPTNFENNTVQPTGVFRGGGCTTRGRAWALRSLAHAIFLTPDELTSGTADPWKAPAKASLAANIAYLDGYRTDPKSKLNICWEGDPSLPQNIPYQATAKGGPVFATRGWFNHYLITEVHKLASARLLSGDSQASAVRLADWLAGFPVRWVNEQPNGGWRYIPYSTVIGRNTTTVDMPDTWEAMTGYVHVDAPPAKVGPWFFSTGDPTGYTTDYVSGDTNRPRYVDYFWAALVAAVERDIPGASTAWAVINSSVTNSGSWRSGFSNEPRWGASPRNAPRISGFGALGVAADAMAAGEWLDWTMATNVRQIADTNPLTGTATGWLESKPNYFMTNWPGNMTWDASGKRLILVGASQGTASDSPAGWSTSAVYLDVTTGLFSKQWNPFNRNSWHVYDANSTRPLGGYIYRTAPSPPTLFKMELATNVWTAADDLTPMGLGFGAVPALEVHPTLGPQGSILVSGSNGRLGRVDRATGAVTVLAETLAGVAGLSPVMSYHPGIDAVVFGGAEFGKSLYKISNSGAITQLSSALPPGVPSLGPDSTLGNTVLAPDPKGRAVAWLFDEATTRKVWRLDLNSGAWTEVGSLPATFAGSASACVGTIPELGVHVWFDGNGRENSVTSGARVWIYKPA